MLPPSPASSILSLHKIQLQVLTSSAFNVLSCTRQQGTRAPELPHLLPPPPLCTSVHPNFQDTNLMKINGYPPNTHPVLFLEKKHHVIFILREHFFPHPENMKLKCCLALGACSIKARETTPSFTEKVEQLQSSHGISPETAACATLL